MTSHIPMLKTDEKLIWFNDDLEHCMPVSKVSAVMSLWNEGMSIQFISKRLRVDEWEVLFCLIHLFRRDKDIRPFALSYEGGIDQLKAIDEMENLKKNHIIEQLHERGYTDTEGMSYDELKRKLAVIRSMEVDANG